MCLKFLPLGGKHRPRTMTSGDVANQTATVWTGHHINILWKGLKKDFPVTGSVMSGLDGVANPP
jgi:hypothetical protein